MERTGRLREQEFWIKVLQSDAPIASRATCHWDLINETNWHPVLASDTSNKHEFQHAISDANHSPRSIQLTSPSSPIYSLPAEVLIPIFNDAILSLPHLKWNQTYVRFIALMKLSHVCRIWRNVVSCCMPMAWSQMSVYAPQTLGLVRLVELWLIRTGDNCSLDLILAQGFSVDSERKATMTILTLFMSYVDRWRSFILHMRSQYARALLSSLPTPSNLSTVKLILKDWDMATQRRIWHAINGSKVLRNVTWYYFIPPSPPWSQLEEIDLDIDDISFLVRNLSQLANLKSLCITRQYGLPGLNDDVALGDLKISLPSLQTLRLSGLGSVDFCPLIDHLVAPVLQDLLLHRLQTRARGPSLCIRVLRHLERSNCTSLVILDLSDLRQTSDEILAFLTQSTRYLTRLRTFKLLCGAGDDRIARWLTIRGDDDDDDHMLSMGGEDLLPSLQTLNWNTWSHGTSGLLGKMLRSRFRHGSLRSADIHVRGGRGYEAELSILRSLKDEGRDVRWRIRR